MNINQQTIKAHYQDIHTGKMVSTEHNAFVITPALLELDNVVCLINTCFDYTEFESVPAKLEKWIDKFGMDCPHFPNIDRIWGPDKSVYAFSLHYEIANEHSDSRITEYPFTLSYQEQLDGIIQAAVKIAEAIPYAAVRVNEQAACRNCHDLEIDFFYPCDPALINKARDILERQFDYVWFIGMEKGAKEAASV